MTRVDGGRPPRGSNSADLDVEDWNDKKGGFHLNHWLKPNT